MEKDIERAAKLYIPRIEETSKKCEDTDSGESVYERILNAFFYTKIYSVTGRKEIGVHCRNQNEYGQFLGQWQIKMSLLFVTQNTTKKERILL